MSDAVLLARVIDSVNVGVIVLDSAQRVVLWNGWMERHAQLPLADVEGKTLSELFPDMANGRVQQTVVSALTANLSSVLSQSLNKAPFPLFSSVNDRENGVRMQQAIQVTPIVAQQPRYCLIQITDVTLSVALV